MVIQLVEILKVVLNIVFKILRQMRAIVFCELEHAFFSWMELLIEGEEQIKIRGEKLTSAVIDAE